MKEEMLHRLDWHFLFFWIAFQKQNILEDTK